MSMTEIFPPRTSSKSLLSDLQSVSRIYNFVSASVAATDMMLQADVRTSFAYSTLKGFLRSIVKSTQRRVGATLRHVDTYANKGLDVVEYTAAATVAAVLIVRKQYGDLSQDLEEKIRQTSQKIHRALDQLFRDFKQRGVFVFFLADCHSDGHTPSPPPSPPTKTMTALHEEVEPEPLTQKRKDDLAAKRDAMLDAILQAKKSVPYPSEEAEDIPHGLDDYDDAVLKASAHASAAFEEWVDQLSPRERDVTWSVASYFPHQVDDPYDDEGLTWWIDF